MRFLHLGLRRRRRDFALTEDLDLREREEVLPGEIFWQTETLDANVPESDSINLSTELVALAAGVGGSVVISGLLAGTLVASKYNCTPKRAPGCRRWLCRSGSASEARTSVANPAPGCCALISFSRPHCRPWVVDSAGRSDSRR